MKVRTALVVTALAVVAGSAAAAGFLFGVPGLAVRDARHEEVAFLPLGRDATFEISFLHSVARRPVVESFQVGPGGMMVLVGTVYAGLGAGLPFGDEGGKVSIRDGKIVLEGLHREFVSIPLLPLPLTEHRLHAGGRTADLAALTGGRGVVVLTIERRSAAVVAGAAIADWIRGDR